MLEKFILLLRKLLFYKYTSKTKNFNKFFTIPNIITIVRTIISLILIYLFSLSENIRYLYISLFIFIFGDILDGFISRKFGKESISGAILDIIADRLVYPIYYFYLSLKHKELTILFVLFLLSFNFLDFYLSINFLRARVESINYFYRFNEKIYFLNFTPLTKFLNSGLLLILVIIYLYIVKSIVFYIFIIAYLIILVLVKVYSIFLLEKKLGET